MQASAADDKFEFGNFRLNRRSGELYRTDTDPPAPVPIGRRALDVLHVLLAHPGHLVTKQEIMDAVWPGLAVEENNLTVQISALRRCLDQAGERSCIENIPGRGYRFVLPVRHVDESAADPAEAGGRPGREVYTPAAPGPRVARRHWLGWVAASAALLAGAGGLTAIEWGGRLTRSTRQPPRLSLAVLPFDVQNGDAALERFADAVTGTLTTDLASPVSLGYFSPSLIVPHQAVAAQSGKLLDPRGVGTALGVRYVLTGSVRTQADKLQVSAELVSAESGALLWADRYEDTALTDPRVIAGWIRPEATRRLIDIEAARSLRERPRNPDEMDLLMQAKSWELQQPSPQRMAKARDLYERALQLDPGSVNAMTGLGFVLLELLWFSDLPPQDGVKRVEGLLSRAEAIRPNSPEVMWDRGFLLMVRERWPEAAAEFDRLNETYPIYNGPEHMLGFCYLLLGRTEAAIELFQLSIREAPRHPAIWSRYSALATALVLLGRHDEGIAWAQRGLAANPENSPIYRARQHLTMAGAFSLGGRSSEARIAAFEATRIWPYMTARGYWPGTLPSSRFASQIARFEEALRLAGLRDHANEGADYGVATQADLRDDLIGPTPIRVPGVSTILAADLAAFRAENRPVVVDTAGKGRSLPGAIGLRGSGVGGSITGSVQDRLRTKFAELMHGEMAAPIVTLDWNAERWGGYNLALRLAGLRYTNVIWYRGGQEAWQASGAPTADVVADDW